MSEQDLALLEVWLKKIEMAEKYGHTFLSIETSHLKTLLTNLDSLKAFAY